MIDDLIKLLDEGAAQGVGHINVAFDEEKESRDVQTFGCPDCSAVPLACSLPTLHDGLDAMEEE